MYGLKIDLIMFIKDIAIIIEYWIVELLIKAITIYNRIFNQSVSILWYKGSNKCFKPIDALF